ncbi:hypothetical protein [Arthrobacter sp. ok362]|jgi:hypothetical protein|uniref:hypothetical protein n=1 Tax=Arthrobacter sp. ok362 TaxID=1761745 RepID=UPI000889F8F9|nr:hypothetical protein [Arthrobacter sp. ok362]SDK60569.1 hypothetical protein SAMN04487913_10282 [Arthrobacter sp. ok362]
MSAHFDRFLAEALTTDRETDGGLAKEELYGLYTSWCLINQSQPEPAEALWAALESHRIKPDNNTLAMSGPAALDYIVCSSPDLA